MSRYKPGTGSLKRLKMLRREMRRICLAMYDKDIVDFGVLCSYRDQRNQNEAYESGTSKLKFPNSKHNKIPSDAVDLQVYIKGKGYMTDKENAIFLAGMFLTTAVELGYKGKVRWGGNWDRDGEIITDQTFQDFFHFEWIGD